MTEKSLDERVSALEAQLSTKTIEEHFRDQAELIDRRFSDAFREQAELIDRLFVFRFDEFRKQLHAELEATLDAKLETKLDAKFKPIKTDVAIIKHSVGVILTRLT